MEKSGFGVEDDEIIVWSLNLWKLQFSPWTLEKLQIGPWNIIQNSGQNWWWIMGKILI